MTLVQLQYFQAVCRHKSVTAAAQALHVSQPSVSNSIRELEREYHITLFQRVNKELLLTAEGRQVLEQTGRLLAARDALTRQMAQLRGAGQPVRVGIPPMIGTFLFPRLLQSFRFHHPEIRLIIEEHGSAHTARMVEQERLDLALVITDAIKWNDLNVVPVGSSQIRFAVSADHPLAGLSSVRFEDLADEPLVMYKEDYYLHEALCSRFRQAGVEPCVFLYSNQLYIMKTYVAQGMASTFLFEDILRQEPELTGIPLDSSLKVNLGLVWKKGRYLHADALALIDHIKQRGGAAPT